MRKIACTFTISQYKTMTYLAQTARSRDHYSLSEYLKYF